MERWEVMYGFVCVGRGKVVRVGGSGEGKGCSCRINEKVMKIDRGG